ncbi:hypothetical protein H310_10493 [Aphanomyces invadans]|uniref:Fibronectin type-III domain-containing protein n=1 Tax=Aphanomyces invadans TaxID=157072 RepID=A0A024TRT7_9STRA|nr:hypothetical protein H310_10493 [Aphanomyces invadans]ETV96331.1 hypothetical protein H310_10493 [Aphanomyces invadans]|eukprot:XP_008875123.1 hypothetical protein H310_10493 [Aphanomyces invadans]
MTAGGIQFVRGQLRRLDLKWHLPRTFGILLLITTVSRTSGVVTTCYLAAFLAGIIFTFSVRWIWIAMGLVSLGGVAGQCVVAGWPTLGSNDWILLAGLQVTPYNVSLDAIVMVMSALLLFVHRQGANTHTRHPLRREVSGVRTLAFIFQTLPILHTWVLKLKLHETIHGLFAFVAELLIVMCLFIAALSSRSTFGALYYFLLTGRLAIWSFWLPRHHILHHQNTQLPTPGRPVEVVQSPPMLKETAASAASNQDGFVNEAAIMMVARPATEPQLRSTSDGSPIEARMTTDQESHAAMAQNNVPCYVPPPPHPLVNKLIVRGLLVYTFSVLIFLHVYQYPVLHKHSAVRVIGKYTGAFVLPGTVADNWLDYIFLTAIVGLYVSLAKMRSFYASYEVLPLRVDPPSRHFQAPVVMRVLRNELIAACLGMFWAISYPSYASLGLFALSLLTLATHGLKTQRLATLQPIVLSLTTLYAVCTGLVQYTLMMPALQPVVSTPDLALDGHTHVDLAIQNAVLVSLCLCQRARVRYARPVGDASAPTPAEPPSPHRLTFLNDTWNAYYHVMQLWCVDAKGAFLRHVDSMVLFTIYVVVLSTSVNLFQTGSLVLATYLALFHHHRRRLWRVLLVYTLAVCLTLYTWNISCPSSTALHELVGLTATLTTLWGAPLFNAQLILIAQVVLQLVIYTRKWHTCAPDTTRLPIYFVSRCTTEIDRVFRVGGVVVCYVVLLAQAFTWEVRRGGHVTIVGLVQLVLFLALVDSHVTNLWLFPRGTAHYRKLWRVVLVVQLLVVVLRYLYQFAPVSNAILTHWLPPFCTMDDVGFESLSSTTHLSNLFGYLFPTVLMAGLAAWQIASMNQPVVPITMPVQFQKEWVWLCRAMSRSSVAIVALAMLLATDTINLMGFLYYLSAIYAVLNRKFMAAWPYLFTASCVVLLGTYVLQLNLVWFDTANTTETRQWLRLPPPDDSVTLWTTSCVPLLMIGLCALQRVGALFEPTFPPNCSPTWLELMYANHVVPLFTRDTSVTLLMLALLVSCFVHLNAVSIVYMVVVRCVMLTDWNEPKVHQTYVRVLTGVLVGVSIVQYLLLLWFPAWLVVPSAKLPPWTWLDTPYQAWLMLSFQNKWSLVADFTSLFALHLIPPPPAAPASAGAATCDATLPVDPAGHADVTIAPALAPTTPPLSLQVFVANYSISVVLVGVFITGCAQFGVASGLYLGWSIYMLFHLDRLDWQPILLESLQAYNWFYLLLLVVYQCPLFNDITQTCTLGTNQPLGDGICLSVPVALGLYKAPRSLDTATIGSATPSTSTMLSIAIFVMIAIQMQVFASAPYRLVLESHRRDQERCLKRGYAMNDHLAKVRIQQWRHLKLEKQAAIQRLKAIVSKLVNKVEEMMDIAMGLHYSLPPMAPHRPRVVSTTQNSITLSWDAPESKIHKIRGYRISRQTCPSMTLLGDFGDVVSVPASQTMAEIHGLRPGTSYQFKVAAVSRMGEGPFSVASEPAATVELDWGDACTAGWLKAHRTIDHKSNWMHYAKLFMPWAVPTTYSQRYVIVDAMSITFYKSEVLAIKHRRGADKARVKRRPGLPPRHPNKATGAAGTKQYPSYLLSHVTRLDLSEHQLRLDEMSPLLYCMELTIAHAKGPDSIHFSFQPENAAQFDRWIVALMFVVPPQSLGARLLAYRQAQNLAFPERIMQAILAPSTCLDESSAKVGTDKVAAAPRTFPSAKLSRWIDPVTQRAIYANAYRLFWSLQDSALQGESIACPDDIESDELPSWTEFRVVVTHAIRSHSAKLCYAAFVAAFSRQGDALNVVYVAVLFGVLLCENPRPRAALWKWVLKYSFAVVLVRYMFQLPFFCHHYTVHHTLYPSFQPFCPVTLLNATTTARVQPIVLLGLYKFDGSANGDVNSTFQGLQWNFVVICSILFHRRELQARGFWVYPGNEALQWTRTALWKRLFQSRRSFQFDDMGGDALQQNPVVIPDVQQVDDVEHADRMSRLDSKDSLDERDFELADYLAKKNNEPKASKSRSDSNTANPPPSRHTAQKASMDLTCHLERLLENESPLPPVVLNPMAPSFDHDDDSDDTSDDEATPQIVTVSAKPTDKGKHLSAMDSGEIGRQHDVALASPLFPRDQQQELGKKSRFQSWLSKHMPSWMVEYYGALLPRPPVHWDRDIKCAVAGAKPGRDYVLPSFALHVVILAYTVLFFQKFGNAVEMTALFSITSTFETSLLSGYMVGLVFFHVILVLWDRVSYVYSSLESKLWCHYFMLVGVHVVVWLVLPLHTGVYFHASPSLVVLYLLQCAAMGVSAAQLKHGYVVFRGNPFSLRHATKLSKTLFSVYMAIPFAFEIRTLLDYLCSTTALDMQLWLVLEGIGAHLFLVKLQMEGRVQDGFTLQGNQRQPWQAKFKSAGVYFVALVVCLLAPMVMFRTANPTTIRNPVQHATITFGLLQPDGTFQQFYNSEENESPATQKVVVANVETYVQQVSFMEFSNDMWSSSPPPHGATKLDGRDSVADDDCIHAGGPRGPTIGDVRCRVPHNTQATHEAHADDGRVPAGRNHFQQPQFRSPDHSRHVPTRVECPSGQLANGSGTVHPPRDSDPAVHRSEREFLDAVVRRFHSVCKQYGACGQLDHDCVRSAGALLRHRVGQHRGGVEDIGDWHVRPHGHLCLCHLYHRGLRQERVARVRQRRVVPGIAQPRRLDGLGRGNLHCPEGRVHWPLERRSAPL